VLANYGALRGRPLTGRIEADDPDSPHYQIHVVASGVHHRVAVNVQSSDHASLLYLAIEDFRHPIVERFNAVQPGFTSVPRRPDGLALDFVRGRLFDRRALRPVPATVAGPDNDLNEHLARYVQRAIREATAEMVAFGEPWGPEPRRPDQVFGFRPGRGIHDIHQNQGNDARHRSEDGTWQDGALFFRFADPIRWVALFLAFQSQSARTDDHGHTLR
jgi:uncharacterized protein YukJ